MIKMIKPPEDFGIIHYDKVKFETTGALDCFQSVDLSGRQMTEIPFNFGKIDGCFDCSYNLLKNLKGSPTKINGSFYCHFNKLKSLKYCPSSINGSFFCNSNLLNSLEFCPKEIQDSFYCNNNHIFSLEHAPLKIKYKFCFSNNNLNLSVDNWIDILELCPKSNTYEICDVVQENSSYEITLKSLKMKQQFLKLMNN